MPVSFETFYAPWNIWFNVYAYPVEDGIVLRFNDITERKRAEEDLLRSNRNFSALFNNKTTGIAICKTIFDEYGNATDYVVLDINTVYEHMTGIPRDRIVGKRITEAVPGISQDLIDRHNRVAVTGEETRFETYDPVTDRWYDVNVFSQQKGYFTAVFSNITERKKTEEELKAREAQLDAFFANAPGVLNLVDENFCYINTDPLTPTYYGLNRETIKGKCVPDLSRDFMEQTGKVMQHIIETGEPVVNAQYQAPVPKRGGEMAYWNTSMFRVPLGHEKWGVGVISIEVTDLKRSQEKLENSNRELEQFAYVASHDLQEPLRQVASFTELLGQSYGAGFDERGKRYMNYIVEGAQRMQRLIQDLLTFSRLGRRETERGRVDCNLVVDRVVAGMGESIRETNAVVTHDSLPVLQANEANIAQIFQNLIGNAIKFRKKEEPPRVHIAARKTDSTWLFSVRDNGIGIKEQYFEKIFIIFRRLHTREQYPGTGIGLAIVKKIVDAYGGKVWVESEPGKGSTFFFTIPQ
jgi:PAS domain S-box-containing protein